MEKLTGEFGVKASQCVHEGMTYRVQVKWSGSDVGLWCRGTAMSNFIEYRYRLVMCHRGKVIQELVKRLPARKVIQQSLYGDTGTLKYRCTT